LNDNRLQESDVICTCTASEEALIGLKQVKTGVHINGISLVLFEEFDLEDLPIIEMNILFRKNKSLSTQLFTGYLKHSLQFC
jgi:ornithine cyclodeaminase/alanine dehydrogenase-like protein (mu-crystallin family)